MDNPHNSLIVGGCPKCKARPNNIKSLPRRLGDGTAIFESSCIQCGWNKSTPIHPLQNRKRVPEPIEVVGPEPPIKERIPTVETKPKRKRKEVACVTCERVAVVVGRGMCGRCYMRVLRSEKSGVPVVLKPAVRQMSQTLCPVNHPQHYTSHPSGIECIQITEHMGFNLGNALKYIWRADLKGSAIEDLQKAEFYIKREIERRSKGA